MQTVQLFNSDWARVLPKLANSVDAIVSDPPYGSNNNCDYSRFRGGKRKSNKFKPIEGDDKPFDPSPFLSFPKVALFGFQHFSDKLPPGGVLSWLKKRDSQLGHFLSDCELAWIKGRKGCYCFRHIWNGFDRESERGRTLHPTQKPVALMRWVIQQQNLPPGSTICDPFMGSGSTAIAALELGHNFIGCEIDSDTYEVAASRVREATSRFYSRLTFPTKLRNRCPRAGYRLFENAGSLARHLERVSRLGSAV